MIPVAGKAVLISGTGQILDENDTPKAWAEAHVTPHPDIKWILGNYVEAEHPNNNGHIFPLDDLLTAQQSVAYMPLNMVHREHYIVGNFVQARLLRPAGEEFTRVDLEELDNSQLDDMRASEAMPRPYMEALAAMWHNLFPDEFVLTQKAHANGTLFYSMECVPETVTCPISFSAGCAGSCGVGCAPDAMTLADARARGTAAVQLRKAGTPVAADADVFTRPFIGLTTPAGTPADAAYCEAMNGRTHPKRLDKPRFKAGALIIPPVRPGWSSAQIKAIAKLVHDNEDEAEAIYAAVSNESPHLDTKIWEQVMAMVMQQAHGVE